MAGLRPLILHEHIGPATALYHVLGASFGPADCSRCIGDRIGLPIGLGIYLAWVQRDWSATTRTVGFAAAVGGALIGGWLGFNATTGFAALLTTIAGAAAGANLTLLALDIAWDRSAHDLAAVEASHRPASTRTGA
jgi:hypothetical protein